MRIQPALSLALGVVLAVLTLEVVSRCYYNYRSVPDHDFGLLVPAGHTVRSMVEGVGVAHFQEQGLRRAHNATPSYGRRILCLGDSFTEAFQVTDHEMFTTLTESILRSAGIPARVLAFGRSTWSVADYIAKHEPTRTRFAPDWTVVQVQDADFEADAWDTSKTHFRRDCDTCDLEIVNTAPPPMDKLRAALVRFRNQSAFVGFLFARRGLFSRPVASSPQLPAAKGKLGASARTAFPVEEELRMLNDAFEGRITLLLLARFEPRDPWHQTDGESAISEAARKIGLSMVSTRDEYPRIAAAGLAPYGFGNTEMNAGHMNAVGHAAAAKVLARELTKLGAAGRL